MTETKNRWANKHILYLVIKNAIMENRTGQRIEVVTEAKSK